MLLAKQSSASSASSAVFLVSVGKPTAEDAEDAEEPRDCERATHNDPATSEYLSIYGRYTSAILKARKLS